MEELLINAKIGGDNISKLTSDVDKLGTEVTDTAKAYDKLETSTEKLTKTSTKAGSEMLRLRKEIKAAKDEMLKAEEGSARYNAALAKAGELQFKLKDLNDKARLSVQDFGQTAKNVGGTVAGIGGAFQVAQGAMALFGVENDAMLQTILKLQAGMSVVSGLATFADSIDSMRDLYTGLKASGQDAAGATGAITEMSKVSDEAAHSAANLAKESAVIGSNLAGVGVQTDNYNKLTDKLIANGGKEIDVVDRLIKARDAEQQALLQVLRAQNSKSLTQKIDLEYAQNNLLIQQANLKLIEDEFAGLSKLEQAKGEIIKIEQALQDLSDKDEKVGLIEEEYKATEDLEKRKASLTSEVTDLEAAEAKNNKTVKEGKEGMDKAGTSILKTMGTMVLITAVIAGVIYGITKLIEWLNKIPLDLEIKIRLNEESYKKLGDVQTNINKFQKDYDKAVREHDINRLKQLDKYAQKEYDITELKLKEIKKVEDGWNKFFINYITNIQKVAFNEARIREGAQLEYEGKKIASEQKILEDAIRKAGVSEKDITDMKKGGNPVISSLFGDKVADVQEANKMISLWNEATDKIIENNKKLAVLKKVSLYDVQNLKLTTEPTGGSTSTTSTSVSTTGGSDYKTKTKELEQYTKYFDVTYTQYIDNYAGLTQEENAIRANQMLDARRDRQLTASEELRMQKAVIDARLWDLNMAKETAEKEIQLKTGTRNAAIAGNKKIIDDLDIQFEAKKAIYNKEIDAQNIRNKKIESLEELNKNIAEDANKSKSEGYKKSAQEKIKANNLILDAYKSERDAATDSLGKQLTAINELQTAKTKAETDLAAAIESGGDISGLQTKIDTINGQIIDASAAAAQNVRDSWEAAFEGIQIGLEKVGNTLSSLSNINDLMMTTIDNKTNHEKNSLELSDKYQKASSEEQTKMMYELDKKNYDSKVKLFETKKLYDIGVVTVETISGGIAAVTQGVKQFGPVAGAIIGGIEAAVIVGGGIAAVKEIQSRTLDAPIPPNTGGVDSGAAQSAANIALNPSKTSLTSKEENLNMMNQSGQSQVTNVVKVSDINKVQATVKTRETNSSY